MYMEGFTLMWMPYSIKDFKKITYNIFQKCIPTMQMQ
jgi:hypothetical protein